mmetsp:Transcript_52234/g.168194  ORF Transcript_52234/g.168194 Transcript_52234/m.168194 type:complete len:235 (-) Transcript_52234:586-1290(-)
MRHSDRELCLCVVLGRGDLRVARVSPCHLQREGAVALLPDLVVLEDERLVHDHRQASDQEEPHQRCAQHDHTGVFLSANSLRENAHDVGDVRGKRCQLKSKAPSDSGLPLPPPHQQELHQPHHQQQGVHPPDRQHRHVRGQQQAHRERSDGHRDVPSGVQRVYDAAGVPVDELQDDPQDQQRRGNDEHEGDEDRADAPKRGRPPMDHLGKRDKNHRDERGAEVPIDNLHRRPEA